MPDTRKRDPTLRNDGDRAVREGGLSINPDILDAKGLENLYRKFESYSTSLEKQPLSPHTMRAYQVRLQHFLGFLGERLADYPDALSNHHTRDYIARDFKQHLKIRMKSSPQTVNAYLTAIDSFYRFLGLGKAKTTREDLPQLAPQALTSKEQKEFLRAVERSPSTRDRALAILLLNTGIRISECAALNIDDVLLSERKGIVKIRSGKGGGYREIPLNSQSREALQNWLTERQNRHHSDDPALFLSIRGGRLSIDSIDHAIRKLAGEAKLEAVSAHTLRHTCLTNLVRQGNDMVLVAQIG
ncbi:MAG: tyrosine-type recombinase/integrase, partial [Candidatus Obscuribacterales bacterium]|nr:tyrosine-type recombinase/integrase [Candidatus Obscuribacterales bacterium]